MSDSSDRLIRQLVAPFGSRDPDARQPGELPDGQEGLNGPNDGMYINHIVRDCAKDLLRAASLWCFGYGYQCERMPADHPIARALAALADADKETARDANRKHEPELFKILRPTDAEMQAFKQRSEENRRKPRTRDGEKGSDGPSGPA